MSDRKQIWSSGGGTQSTAIAAMIVSGNLPKPDYAVISDTGREASEVWEYMEKYVKPALSGVGVDLVRVHKNKYATVDLFGGKSGKSILMPAYAWNEKQRKEGKLSGYCSNEWKWRVIQRWARDQCIHEADVWVGITIDEIHRAKFGDNGKWRRIYPLIEKRISRSDCIAAVEKMGWPTPPRSSCWMCPNRQDHEWRHLKEVSPDDFRRAVKLEKYLQKTDPNVWLHRSCVPLEKVEFYEKDDLFSDIPCSAGNCFV